MFCVLIRKDYLHPASFYNNNKLYSFCIAEFMYLTALFPQTGCTPLIDACRSGMDKAAAALIKDGADINTKDEVSCIFSFTK